MHGVSDATGCHPIRYISARCSVSIHFSSITTPVLINYHSGSVPSELDLREETNSMLSNGTAGFFDSFVSTSLVSPIILC